MRYSISGRFRGTILGMAIGAWLGKASSKQYLSSANATSTLLHRMETQNLSGDADVQSLSVVVSAMKTLIQRGRFDVEDWRSAFDKNGGLSTLHSLVATLPIALLYHENEIKLRQNLQLALAAVGQDEPESQDCTLAVGYAIARSVQAKLNWSELISQTIAFLGSQTETLQKLVQVKALLEQNAGLERAVNTLGIMPHQPSSQIALAFYCYLSSLEEFPLAVKRAVHKSFPAQLTSAITGALSGAYNGLASIPATLRLPLFSNSTDVVSVIATAMTTEAEMLRLCDALVAVWSGVYEQGNPRADLTQIAAIAAPRVMRTR